MVPDQTLIEIEATLYDGVGNNLPLHGALRARSSNLTASIFRLPLPYTEAGKMVEYELFMRNTGTVVTKSTATVSLPPELTLIDGSVVCAAGTCEASDQHINWQGTLVPRAVIAIRFRLRVPSDAAIGEQYTSTLIINDANRGENIALSATLSIAHLLRMPSVSTKPLPLRHFLPIIGR
jgi:hypothetical protein